jgi:hypothetical protein
VPWLVPAPSFPPSCCTSSAARFLHRDKGSPRPPLRRKGSQESPDDNLSDHDHDHASIELTASVCAWQPSFPRIRLHRRRLLICPPGVCDTGFYTRGEFRRFFSTLLTVRPRNTTLLNDLCGVARLFTITQDGVGRC